MAEITLTVTKVAVAEQDGKKITSTRLLISGRSMWLNIDALKTRNLDEKKGTLVVDDQEFNHDKYEVLKCTNEHGAFLKLVPKCGFKLADF